MIPAIMILTRRVTALFTPVAGSRFLTTMDGRYITTMDGRKIKV